MTWALPCAMLTVPTLTSIRPVGAQAYDRTVGDGTSHASKFTVEVAGTAWPLAYAVSQPVVPKPTAVALSTTLVALVGMPADACYLEAAGRTCADWSNGGAGVDAALRRRERWGVCVSEPALR